MPETLSVAEIKRRFSQVTNEILFLKKRFVIERKGKPIAALVGIEDFKEISKDKIQPKGLLAAMGAWSEFKDLDNITAKIYKNRTKAKDRKVEGFRVSLWYRYN